MGPAGLEYGPSGLDRNRNSSRYLHRFEVEVNNGENSTVGFVE